jgi:hypothetical protein
LLEESWWETDPAIQQWIEEQRDRPRDEVDAERVLRVRIRESEALQALMASAALADKREELLMRVLTERPRDLGAQAGAILLQFGYSARAADIARVLRGWDAPHIGRVLSALVPEGDSREWLPLARSVVEDLLAREAPVSEADDPYRALFQALRVVALSTRTEDRQIVEAGVLARPHDPWSWILASRSPLSEPVQARALGIWNDQGLPLDLRLATALVLRSGPAGVTDATIVDALVGEIVRRSATSAIGRKLPDGSRERGPAPLLAILYECNAATVAARVPELVTGQTGLLALKLGEVLGLHCPTALLGTASQRTEAGRAPLATALFDVGERQPVFKDQARALVSSTDLQKLEAESPEERARRRSTIYYMILWRPLD